ncbi:MAG TPA: T9SS type A sorting domain-containing protein [Flavipsychrobacter sp.]|nr:T9SS type A sorting domain-containing protein [Flavipsychrobacter sp.]
MKRTLRFLSILGGIFVTLLCAQNASAQVTSVTANYYDSSYSYCNTPAPVSGFGMYYATGVLQANDSTDFYINYGDGSDTSFRLATQMQFTFTVNHTYLTTGTFQIMVAVTNVLTSATDTVYGNTYVVTNTCSSLQGLVWGDTDADCAFDTGESLFSYVTMKVTNTTTLTDYYVSTDANGMYYIEVPDNYTYTIQMANLPGGLTPVCPVTGIANQAVSGTGTFTNDFGYDCNSMAVTDFSVTGGANFFRPGHVRHLYVSAHTNNICQGHPATVTLVLDNLLSCVGTYGGTPPTSVVGQVVTWNVSSLSLLGSLYSNLQIYCDSAAVLGDTLCNQLYISYTGVTDTIPQNDTADICRAVSNSYDPNNKEVSPNNGPLGLIENGELLTYVINFQNTGTDTAYNVVIVDTLSSNLNVNTFQLIEATHPVNVTWLPGNVINFRFENIYLPDSNVNEPLSHGSVAYRINAKTGLPQGTQINNTAHIYFDFNPAIVTNTTLNTINIPLSVYNVTNGVIAAKVYPNPANNELTIATEGIRNFTAHVSDLLGRNVVTTMTNTGKAVINTSSLPAGMYILNINADGKEMSTKISVQH